MAASDEAHLWRREEALLYNLSEEVRQCYEHAEQCASRARAAQDEELRADYLRLAQGWLKLGQSYGLRHRLTLFINEATRRKNDPNQNIRPLAAENKKMVWQPISIAPFDRDIELAVRDGGDLHALVFPCRRILGGWVNAATKERICVNPTHWRHWSDPTSSAP
jgi:hypothetical protein